MMIKKREMMSNKKSLKTKRQIYLKLLTNLKIQIMIILNRYKILDLKKWTKVFRMS